MASNRRNEILGAAKRAAIEAALLAAGDRGMSAAELATAIGGTGKSCYYQAWRSTHTVHAKTTADTLSRWYHVNNEAAADAYVERVNNRVRKRNRWSDKTAAAAVEFVKSAGCSGADTRAISAALGISAASTRPMMSDLLKAGHVICLRRAFGKTYFAPDQKPAAPEKRARRPTAAPVRQLVLSLIKAAGAPGIGTKQLVDATGLSPGAINHATKRLCDDAQVAWEHDVRVGKSRPLRYWAAGFQTIKQPVFVSKKHVYECDRIRRSAGSLAATSPQPASQTADVEAQIEEFRRQGRIKQCPAGTDHRFTVHKKEDFFSAMGKGQYLPADTWAARCTA